MAELSISAKVHTQWGQPPTSLDETIAIDTYLIIR